MNIKQLKKSIEDNEIELSGQIWKITDESSYIITDQYIHEIANNNHLNIKIIDSILEIPDESFEENNNLYVIYTDSADAKYSSDNCIVICKNTKLDSIDIPKLEDWQVRDYLAEKVRGIPKTEIEWLLSQYGNNYRRLITDINKLKSFNEGLRYQVYSQMLEDGQFSDMTSLNIWDLTNGLVRRDTSLVKEVLKRIKYIDIEPLGLITTLYNSFREVINIQLNTKATAENCGISGKKFFVIKKYNCGHYTKEELIHIFKIITNAEYMFKYGGLEVDQLIEYLIINILGV